MFGINEICEDPYGVEFPLFMLKKGSRRDAVDAGNPFRSSGHYFNQDDFEQQLRTKVVHVTKTPRALTF